MSNPPEPREPALDDVLFAYLAEAAGPDSSTLAVWVHRYPVFARELTEFAAAWAVLKWLPGEAGAAAEAEAAGAVRLSGSDHASLVARGLEVVRQVYQRTAPPAPAPLPLRGLLHEAQSQGLSLADLARRVGLGVAVLRKLDRRLVRFATIPEQALQALADALGRDRAAVAAYLGGSPTFAMAASYRAEAAPTLAEPEDFFDAVRDDPTLPEDQRRAWLRLAPTDRGA